MSRYWQQLTQTQKSMVTIIGLLAVWIAAYFFAFSHTIAQFNQVNQLKDELKQFNSNAKEVASTLPSQYRLLSTRKEAQELVIQSLAGIDSEELVIASVMPAEFSELEGLQEMYYSFTTTGNFHATVEAIHALEQITDVQIQSIEFSSMQRRREREKRLNTKIHCKALIQ